MSMRVILVFNSLKEPLLALSAPDQVAPAAMVTDLLHREGLLAHGAHDLIPIVVIGF